MSCLSTEIEIGLARLDLCPLGHADHAITANELGYSFGSRYIQEGNISDLNRVIESCQAMLDLCPIGHPEHAAALGNLSIFLWHYYSIQRNESDLVRVIDMQQRWLDLCPPNHPDHARALGTLAVSLQEHYYVQENPTDLDRIIEMKEEFLDLYPIGHPIHGIALGNLAASLNARYHRLGDLTDLNRDIDLKEKCLKLPPSNQQDHGLDLRNLALSLVDRYNRVESHSDLVRAIQVLKEALSTYPVQHYCYALTIGQLAAAIILSSNTPQGHPPNQSLPPLDEAFETYQLLKKCSPAVTLYLWNATKAWVQDAEDLGHSSVLDAYRTSLDILDHFTSFNSSLDSRHEIMQARVADLANNAFSCSTRHGNFQMAVELLEQGRGILWNQLARFDISLVALERLGHQGHALKNRFTQLSADLRKHAQGSGLGGSIGPYWRVQEEWESVVDKIRCLDGFSRFLLPPRFDDLQRAAVSGPIIIVNASEYACDALIVLHTRPPVHVSLPCSLADAIQLCSNLSELTHDPNAYGSNRESWVKQMLRELWSSVVEPIVAVLQDDIQLPPGSRIWWCPTSKFTILPFHAAGPHRKALKNLLDIYVSSYAPSLSALIRARDRVRVQREARNASGTAHGISFAAVGQAKPSKDTKLSDLPQVGLEIHRIQHETGMPPDVTFESVTDAAATIDGTVQAFRDHRWVHVACHGAQHATKPFESWFAMGDGKLTLMRISQERYTNSEFAFLSACHTALGDASTPDEVLHLAAGMQFAGFNGVIGTLWKVDDAVAHQVVTRFYREMFKRPVIDFEYAATALNTAVVESVEEVSLEKRIVFVHIGI